MLFDQVHLTIQSGNGGNGCESLHRRPDKKVISTGGDGGRGGHVIFKASTDILSLKNFKFRQHIVAESGGHGGSNRRHGKNGKDLTVLVPVGTTVIDRDRKLLIRQLDEPGSEVIVSEGGKGGRGNYGGKTSSLGEPGKTLSVELKFQLQADIYLVGLPSSGKSTLMNALTRTQIKEEPYPFSTKFPELGVHNISDYESVTLCELPSIYEASHEGRGCGDEFLKHMINAKFVFWILEPVSKFAADLNEGMRVLSEAIRVYDEELLNLPRAIIVNKMDDEIAQKAVKEQKFRPDVRCFFVSAKTGQGLDEVIQFIKEKRIHQHA